MNTLTSTIQVDALVSKAIKAGYIEGFQSGFGCRRFIPYGNTVVTTVETKTTYGKDLKRFKRVCFGFDAKSRHESLSLGQQRKLAQTYAKAFRALGVACRVVRVKDGEYHQFSRYMGGDTWLVTAASWTRHLGW